MTLFILTCLNIISAKASGLNDTIPFDGIGVRDKLKLLAENAGMHFKKQVLYESGKELGFTLLADAGRHQRRSPHFDSVVIGTLFRGIKYYAFGDTTADFNVYRIYWMTKRGGYAFENRGESSFVNYSTVKNKVDAIALLHEECFNYDVDVNNKTIFFQFTAPTKNYFEDSVQKHFMLLTALTLSWAYYNFILNQQDWVIYAQYQYKGEVKDLMFNRELLPLTAEKIKDHIKTVIRTYL